MKRRPNNGAESNSALQANIGSVRKVGFTLWSTFKTLVIVLVVCISLSKLLTDSFAWGYDRSLWRVKKWIKAKTFTAVPDRIFTEEELSRFDGSNPDLPIYIAINGHVFDVSSGRKHYEKGSGYNIFAGRDASRAFVTGCFKDHLTHDVRGFDESQMESLRGWVNFYEDKYENIGKVIHAPIDPDSPIPKNCK